MSRALLWFRRDLRLADNPALQALLDRGCTPVPVYIHDQHHDGCRLGSAEAWWLHHSLAALQQSLRKLGSDLLVFQGRPEVLLPELVGRSGAIEVAWNRRYEPDALAREARVRHALERHHYQASVFNAGLLREPGQHLKPDGTPYRIFTPFWNALLRNGPARCALPAPKTLPSPGVPELSGHVSAQALKLLPAVDWDNGFYTHWQPGEAGARKALQRFLDTGLTDYPELRDILAPDGTSRLSPHLHFGELGPVHLWEKVLHHASAGNARGVLPAAERFVRQLGWREFSQHTLYHFPDTATQALDRRFDAFPWRSDYQADLLRWQRGDTGIPLVDAGMRQLWSTGYMHNRVRMITASFLSKNLLIPWQEGARWFQDTLVDADLANNTMGWQWTAGCGVDAAPYFRVFNPVLQGRKFDPEGRYVRRWVPELVHLDKRYIHGPWDAPSTALVAAGIVLGQDYPLPMVDLRRSRQRALEAWNHIRHLDRRIRSGAAR